MAGCGKGIGNYGWGQEWSGEGLAFGKLEWKAEHATERSGVKCAAWNGCFPKASQWGMSMFMRPPGWSLQMAYEGLRAL